MKNKTYIALVSRKANKQKQISKWENTFQTSKKEIVCNFGNSWICNWQGLTKVGINIKKLLTGLRFLFSLLETQKLPFHPHNNQKAEQPEKATTLLRSLSGVGAGGEGGNKSNYCSKIGDVHRQVQRVPTYLSRRPQAETSTSTSAAVGKPEL